MSKHIYTREVAVDIINIFEDLLDDYNIDIPNEDRKGEYGEARIYGSTFADTLDEVENMIIELLDICKVNYKKNEWNGRNWIG